MRAMPWAWLVLVGTVTVGSIQACSSVDTQAATAGTGAGGSGSSGSTTAQTASATSSATTSGSSTAAVTSASASSTTGSGGLMCGAAVCADAALLGVVTLPGCCPMNAPPDKCGLDLSGVAAFIGVDLGCMELNQAGDPDATCPDQTIAAMGQMVTLPGCCRPDNVCGNVVDLSMFAPGVNFGCANGATFLDGGAPPACGGGTSSASSSSGSSTATTSSGSGSGSGSGSSGSSSSGG